MQDKPVISFKALRRARSTLEDFTLTYLPLHGLDPLQGLLQHLDLLVFVEACIYEMDEQNEVLTAAGQSVPGHQFPAAAVLEEVLRQEGLWDEAVAAELRTGAQYWRLERQVCAAMKAAPCLPSPDTAGAGPQQSGMLHSPPLLQVPAESQHPSPAAEAGALMRLRQLEHKFVQQRRQQQQQHQQTGLCSSPVTMATGSTPTRTGNPCAANTGGHQALLQHSCQRAPPGAMASTRQAAPQPALSTAASEQQRPLMFDDIIQAHEAKSFDYRVLHLLLHRIRGVPDNTTLLQFCRVDELLVDIGDDLTDYEDDVAANSFNVYRGYLHMFGPDDAPLLLAARVSDLEAQRSALLQQLTPEQQHHVLTRQKAAAQGQGADKWVFPRPILDEAAFRSELATAEVGVVCQGAGCSLFQHASSSS